MVRDEFVMKLKNEGIPVEMHDSLVELFDSMPVEFARNCVGKKFLHGVISPGHLANLDCAGKGPENKIILNGKVVYNRGDFLLWLARRSAINVL